MSSTESVPDVVRRFVIRAIDSVAELEALRLLSSNAEQSWEASQLAERLYISPQAATEVLHALHRHELLTRERTAYRYQPASERLTAEVDALVAAYAKFLIPITQLIHQKPRPALRGFADAFRLRGER